MININHLLGMMETSMSIFLNFVYHVFYTLFGTTFVFAGIAAIVIAMKDW
jgi:hypothetical protein